MTLRKKIHCRWFVANAILFFALVFVAANNVVAQDDAKPQTVVADGKNYKIHVVGQGETLFSICKKYNIDQKDLVEENPQLINGLKKGDELRIPVAGDVAVPEQDVVDKTDDQFIYHIVKKQETIYSISRQYNIPIASIYQFNPEAESGVLENEIIRIPRKSGNKTSDGLIKEDANYFYHKVQSQENVFMLAQRYNAKVADIVALNPGVDEKLEIGTVVKIPKKPLERKNSPATDKAATALPKSNYTLYVTKQGDTFYSIEKKFGVTHEELISANPQMSIVLPLNVEIKVPSKNGEKSVDEEQEQPSWGGGDPSVVKAKSQQSSKPVQKTLPTSKRDTFRIALMMPFMLDKNDSYNKDEVSAPNAEMLDSLRMANPDVLPDGFIVKRDSLGQLDTILNTEYKNKEQRSIYPQTRTTMNFYTGLLLAVDTLTREGVKIRVDVYDTEGEHSNIQSILRKQELLSADLIIGPRDVKLQKPVSAYSAKNQIPMVAPISSDDSLILKNQFYFQTTPAKKIIMQKTADFFAEKYFDKNFVVLVTSESKRSSEWAMVTRMREKVLDNCEKHRLDKAQFTEVPLVNGGEEGSAQIKKALVADGENIVFIPTTDSRLEREAILARTINALNALAKEFQITLIGMNDYPKLESINAEYFHQLNLHYLTPTFVDYSNPEVKRFVELYRQSFHTEPDQYSFRGYDIVTYFVREYQKYGKNYYEQSEKYKPLLLQETFNFQKAGEFCGYINQSLDVVNYNRNWEFVKVADVK